MNRDYLFALKNLTTGEMLDMLRHRDVAINNEGFCVGYDEKGRLLMWRKGNDMPSFSESNQFQFDFNRMLKDKWTIEPYYVSFDEACKAHQEEQKIIVYHHDEQTRYIIEPTRHNYFKELYNDSIRLDELIRGNWQIINHFSEVIIN